MSSSKWRTSLASTVAIQAWPSPTPKEISRPFPSGARAKPAANSTPLVMKKNGRLTRRSWFPEFEPDKAMLIIAPLVPLAHFMDEREPAAVENDRLGAAAKLLGRDRWASPRRWSGHAHLRRGSDRIR